MAIDFNVAANIQINVYKCKKTKWTPWRTALPRFRACIVQPTRSACGFVKMKTEKSGLTPLSAVFCRSLLGRFGRR